MCLNWLSKIHRKVLDNEWCRLLYRLSFRETGGIKSGSTWSKDDIHKLGYPNVIMLCLQTTIFELYLDTQLFVVYKHVQSLKIITNVIQQDVLRIEIMWIYHGWIS